MPYAVIGGHPLALQVRLIAGSTCSQHAYLIGLGITDWANEGQSSTEHINLLYSGTWLVCSILDILMALLSQISCGARPGLPRPQDGAM